MAKEESAPPTETLTADSQPPARSWRRAITVRLKRFTPMHQQLRQRLGLAKAGHLLAGTIALAAAIVTVKQPDLVQLLEQQVQTSFFDIRGPVEPPGSTSAATTGIVILAIDGDSMTQGNQIYPTDPQQYSYLKPIERWPWQRSAYANAIDQLMQAGAKAVVLDVVLDASSSYGAQDDERLRQVLEKYPGRVGLAAQWEEGEDSTKQGNVVSLLMPNQTFRAAAPLVGSINFPLSTDGRIHELGSEYAKRIAQSPQNAVVAKEILEMSQEVPSFAEVALQASRLPYPAPQGQNIFFYGPKDTFPQVPFWHVLDPATWNNFHLKHQTFKNKIVLIGPTAGGGSLQDFHTAPFSSTLRHPEKMAGVEIQANAIATLLEGRSIAPALPNLWLKGLVVALLVAAASYLQSRSSSPLRRFSYGIALALVWGTVSYAVFVQGRLILPTAVPVLAIGLSSTAYLFAGARTYIKKLRRIGRRMADSPEFQSAVSEEQHTDLQQVVDRYQQEIIGVKLDHRYSIVEQIGSGGFGETYKAEDRKRPGNPFCVVKRLRPTNKRPKFMKLAENMFRREAETLERLGKHDQIPQLLAYFEENDDFYLVQEYIEGRPLTDEFKMRSLLKPLHEHRVIVILYELLQILDFVHQQGVIHRDIKPANVIQRRSDGKLVLIDFGAVKQITALADDGVTNLTVAIGTSGYIAPEQAIGRPCAASDIYALGIMGIQALTGISASELDRKRDKSTQELNWRDGVQVSDALTAILDKMVQFKVSDRYPSAQEALQDLSPLFKYAQAVVTHSEFAYTGSEVLASSANADVSVTDDTKLWQTWNSIGLPPTDPVQAVDELNEAITEATKHWTDAFGSPDLPAPDSTDHNSIDCKQTDHKQEQ